MKYRRVKESLKKREFERERCMYTDKEYRKREREIESNRKIDSLKCLTTKSTKLK